MILRALIAMLAGGMLAATPPDAEILELLTAGVKAGRSVGIVAGIIEPRGRRVVSYGSFGTTDPRPVDEESLFEIGSMTKVFTSLLLADMVERGEVALSDPVAKYLPVGVKVPERGGMQITLQDLSMHRSGLPRLPSNLLPKVLDNPYADYAADRMYAALAGYELTRDIGAEYEYSNLGAGLLGHALARRASVDYEALVRMRILEPLGMKSTVITVPTSLKSRLTNGHDGARRRVSYWDFDVLAGAGALRSNAGDILTLLGAFLGYADTPLQPAMRAMLKPRFKALAIEIALGWHVIKGDGNEIVWHNGGTGGFRSFMGFDEKVRVGVVVLSNTAADVDALGLRLLGVTPPPSRPAKERTEITLDPTTLDRYPGTYQIVPGMSVTVTRKENQLFAEITGNPAAYPIFAEGEREFFYKVVDAQITFEPGDAGRPGALILHQLGRDLRAVRVEAKPRIVPAEVAVNPTILDGYPGRYQFANVMVTITRESDLLFAQMTGEEKNRIFAAGDRDFFLKEVDVEIHFAGDNGRAPALQLRGPGGEIRFVRVD